MPKRRAGDSLTGGTHDVNPQVMNLQVTMSSNDAFTTVPVQMPINRLPGPAANSSIIIEILKVVWDTSLTIGSTAGTYSTIACLTTSPLTSLSDATKASPSMIDFYQEVVLNLGAATSVITSISSAPTYHDLTDGAGHGLLVATDKIYLSISRGRRIGAFNRDRIVTFRLFYRLYVRRQTGKQPQCCGERSCARVLPLQGSQPAGVHRHRPEPASGDVVNCLRHLTNAILLSIQHGIY